VGISLSAAEVAQISETAAASDVAGDRYTAAAMKMVNL
jgi:hypothetical protein